MLATEANSLLPIKFIPGCDESVADSVAFLDEPLLPVAFDAREIPEPILDVISLLPQVQGQRITRSERPLISHLLQHHFQRQREEHMRRECSVSLTTTVLNRCSRFLLQTPSYCAGLTLRRRHSLFHSKCLRPCDSKQSPQTQPPCTSFTSSPHGAPSIQASPRARIGQTSAN